MINRTFSVCSDVECWILGYDCPTKKRYKFHPCILRGIIHLTVSLPLFSTHRSRRRSHSGPFWPPFSLPLWPWLQCLPQWMEPPSHDPDDHSNVRLRTLFWSSIAWWKHYRAYFNLGRKPNVIIPSRLLLCNSSWYVLWFSGWIEKSNHFGTHRNVWVPSLFLMRGNCIAKAPYVTQ